jgi:hypothetical protein
VGDACPPDTGCTGDPAIAPAPCPADATPELIKECESRRAAPSRICAQLETDPPTERCYDEGCPPIEPAPAPAVEATPAVEPDIVRVPLPCDPIDKCEPQPLPPETTTRSEDTSLPACDPPVCDRTLPNVRCLPPDCAVSSDGAVYCPAPTPCGTGDGAVACPAPPEPCGTRDGVCSAPGNPGQIEPSGGSGSAPSSGPVNIDPPRDQ